MKKLSDKKLKLPIIFFYSVAEIDVKCIRETRETSSNEFVKHYFQK